MTWEQLRIRLMGLSAYRPLLETEELGACAALLEALCDFLQSAAAICRERPAWDTPNDQQAAGC